METQTTTLGNPLQQFAAYPFDSDETYQQGIAGILASLEGKSDDERTELLLRSRVFYFNRIAGTSIDLDDARTAAENATDPPDVTRSAAEPSSSTADASDEEPRMLSLAELTELIEQGKTDQIPNNRKIPNDLSTEPPSVSTAPIRKKPWEKQSTAE